MRQAPGGLWYLGELKRTRLEPKMGHLTCFAGGMFALGSKHMKSQTDKDYWMDMAKNIGETCHESYKKSPTEEFEKIKDPFMNTHAEFIPNRNLPTFQQIFQIPFPLESAQNPSDLTTNKPPLFQPAKTKNTTYSDQKSLKLTFTCGGSPRTQNGEHTDGKQRRLLTNIVERTPVILA